VDADFETTTAELAELAAAGAVVREPAGTDAVWLATDAARDAVSVAAGSGQKQH
jgi:hypothetical protein